MLKFAPKYERDERGKVSEKPSSRERPVTGPGPQAKKNDGEYHHSAYFNRYQLEELFASFPNLTRLMMSDLETEPPKTGGILGSQEDWNRLENTMNFIDTVALNPQEARRAYYEIPPLEAPPISPLEIQRKDIRTYLDAIDVLEYEPGDDRDAFEEDKKDRRRANPIAKQTTRGLSAVLENARRRFPGEFVEKHVPTEPESVQFHPTSMLPPANPQLKDDLLAELSKIELEK